MFSDKKTYCLKFIFTIFCFPDNISIIPNKKAHMQMNACRLPYLYNV